MFWIYSLNPSAHTPSSILLICEYVLENEDRLVANVLSRSYAGGLSKYISNAKALLAASAKGENPFDGYTPSVPQVCVIRPCTKQHFSKGPFKVIYKESSHCWWMPVCLI
eukprot:scaffold280017_cov31-Prasinocladus_malaysianus.AAC.1